MHGFALAIDESRNADEQTIWQPMPPDASTSRFDGSILAQGAKIRERGWGALWKSNVIRQGQSQQRGLRSVWGWKGKSKYIPEGRDGYNHARCTLLDEGTRRARSANNVPKWTSFSSVRQWPKMYARTGQGGVAVIRPIIEVRYYTPKISTKYLKGNEESDQQNKRRSRSAGLQEPSTWIRGFGKNRDQRKQASGCGMGRTL